MNLFTTRARKRVAIAAVAVAGAAAIGSTAAAQLQSSGGNIPETVVVGGSNYDPTTITKFISGRGFDGSGAVDTQGCVTGAGTMRTSVELPDGARIRQLAFYGVDNDATDVDIKLLRSEATVPTLPGPATLATDVVVTEFTTTGVAGAAGVLSADNLAEVVGNFQPSPGAARVHRFETLQVTLGANQSLCGIEVRYQIVQLAAADVGGIFHAINPVRAYDSRIAAYAENGPIPNNNFRVVDISAGHDLITGAVTASNAVPAGATAITYNLTSDQSTVNGFVAVTPGNATAFGTSSLNLNGTPLANGGTVAIAPDRTIKVWVGGGGSTQVIIDVTGYYTTNNVFPNMAN